MSERNKKIIYGILGVVSVIVIITISILVSTPNSNHNDNETVEEIDTRDVLYQ